LKISNNVSDTYLIIVAKFQINSIIIFEIIKKVYAVGLLAPPPSPGRVKKAVSNTYTFTMVRYLRGHFLHFRDGNRRAIINYFDRLIEKNISCIFGYWFSI